MTQPSVRPSFARDFPPNDALDELVVAFAGGNYARVRAEAPKLAEATEDQEVRRAARVLAARVEADPLAKILLGLTFVLLVLLSAWWVTHDDPPGGAPPQGAPRLIERIHGSGERENVGQCRQTAYSGNFRSSWITRRTTVGMARST